MSNERETFEAAWEEFQDKDLPSSNRIQAHTWFLKGHRAARQSAGATITIESMKRALQAAGLVDSEWGGADEEAKRMIELLGARPAGATGQEWQAGRIAGLREAAKLMNPYNDEDTLGAMNAASILTLAAPIGDNGVQQKDEHARERIARALHYPACWDTAAYPTLDSAALEAIACAKLGCSECEKPYDAPAGPVYRCNQCGSFDIERYPYAASQPAESKRVELTEEQWRIIQAPTGSLLFDAGVHSACTRIRELLARASAKEE
jgi:hypothetical protein